MTTSARFSRASIMGVLKRSGAWAIGLGLLVLAGAVAAVFTVAALAIGLIMALGVALVWLAAKLRAGRPVRDPRQERELEAKRGPRGWTVDLA